MRPDLGLQAAGCHHSSCADVIQECMLAFEVQYSAASAQGGSSYGVVSFRLLFVNQLRIVLANLPGP